MADAYQFVFKSLNDPLRHYHNWNHINRMLDAVYKYGNPKIVLDTDGFIVRPLYEAILFHDIYYNAIPASSNSNEEISATVYSIFAESEGRPKSEIEHVVAMIRATEHHFDGTVYDDYLTNLLLDVDLISFTDDHDDFNETQDQLTAEFCHFYPEGYVISRRLDFLTDIYENKKLQFRVIDPSGALTDIAYTNLSFYLEI